MPGTAATKVDDGSGPSITAVAGDAGSPPR